MDSGGTHGARSAVASAELGLESLWLVLLVHFGLVEVDPGEPGWWQDQLDDQGPDEGEGSHTDADSLLVWLQWSHLEGESSELDESELHDDDDQEDNHEAGVVAEVDEHIVLVVEQLTGVDHVEHLAEDEELENDRVHVALVCSLTIGQVLDAKLSDGFLGKSVVPFFIVVKWPVIFIWKVEPVAAENEQNHNSGDLEDRVTKDVSPHNFVDNLVALGGWLAEEDIIGWGLSSEGKGGKGVHDKVDPKHLHSVERSLLEDNRSEEYDEESDDVDSELELEELPHVVIDVTAVLDSDLDRAEVVVKKFDVGSIDSDFSSRDSHSETNVSTDQSWSIVCTITSDSDSLSETHESVNEEKLISWGRSCEHLQLWSNLGEVSNVSNDSNWLSILNLNSSLDGLAEVLTSHAGKLLFGSVWMSHVLLLEDVGLLRDSNGSVNEVTSAHADVDSSSVHDVHGLSNIWAKWVHEGKDTDHCEVLLNLLVV